MRCKRLYRIASLIVLLLFCQTARSQEDGRQWIQRIARAYEALSSYHFEGVFFSQISGFQNESRSSAFVRDARPKDKKFRYQAGIADSKFTAACDGVSTIVYSGGARQYVKIQSAEMDAVLRDVFKGETAARLGAAFPSEYAMLESKCSAARFLRREPFNLQSGRIDCVVVEAEIIPAQTFPATRTVRTVWIDPGSLAVLRDVTRTQTLSVKKHVMYDAVEEMRVSAFRLNETMADAIFQYEPPRGALLADALHLPASDAGLAVWSSIEHIQLVDLHGKRYSFKELRGNAVLLDFWATWCVPCRKEMAFLENIHQRFKGQGLVVFGVNQESERLQTDFLKKKPFSYAMLSDRGGMLAKHFRASELPTLVLIDRQGRVVEWEQGLQKQEELESLLGLLGIQ